MFPDLEKLKVFQLIKNDEKYQSVFGNRIKRLDLWKSKISSRNLERRFKKCIKLTKDCQIVAESLAQSRLRLLKTFPTSREQIVSRVATMQMNSLHSNKELERMMKTDIGKIAIQQQEEEYQIAEKVVCEAITTKWVKDEITLADFLNKRINIDDDLRSTSAKFTASVLYDSVMVYSTLLSVCMTVSEIAELYRGLFYMGIVNIEGGIIDSKILLDHVKEIGTEVAMSVLGSIPYVAPFLSGLKMIIDVISAIREFKNIDAIPSVINSANFIEEYLSKYQTALLEWGKMAKPTVMVLNNLTKSSKKFMSG